MITQQTTRDTTVTSPAELDAVAALAIGTEAPVSGAPVFSPNANGILLLLNLLSPKAPAEPRGK